jgi:predicted ester cyclase
MVRRIRTAFPDIHFTIDYIIAEGDMVVGAFTLQGTHQGDLHDLAPTGRRVQFKAGYPTALLWVYYLFYVIPEYI